MTEQEWGIVMLAFTDLFDIVKKKAPEEVHINQTFAAGKILLEELKRIRLQEGFRLALSESNRMLIPRGVSSTGMRTRNDWQKQNEELEKKEGSTTLSRSW